MFKLIKPLTITLLIAFFSQASVAKSCFLRCKSLRIAEVQRVWDGLVNGVDRDDLSSLYSDDVLYTDFQIETQNLEGLYEYWSGLYKKFSFVHFRYESSVQKGNNVFIRWTMNAEVVNPETGVVTKLKSKGVSDVQFRKRSTKIISQRDYMDPVKPVAE